MSNTNIRKIGNDIVSAIAGVGGALKQQLRPTDGADGGQGESQGRWLAVTIDRSQDEVAPGGQLPQPLAELGDRIEVQIRPAPGDNGTELAARSRQAVPTGASAAAAAVQGDDPRQAIRSALRQSKQLIEVGESSGWSRPRTVSDRREARRRRRGVGSRRCRSDGGEEGIADGRRAGHGHRPPSRAARTGRAAHRCGDAQLRVDERARRAAGTQRRSRAGHLHRGRRHGGPHTWPQYLYDQVKQQLRLQNDRPAAMREAIYACRKGGGVFSLGVFSGLVDKFPLGAVMNKANKEDGCVRAVFQISS